MIVRAMLQNPNLSFDYFNDFKDTSGWLEWAKQDGTQKGDHSKVIQAELALNRLNDGNRRYWFANRTPAADQFWRQEKELLSRPDYILLNGDYWRTREDEIIVGCTNFILTGQECPHFIALYSESGVEFYAFDCIEALRSDMASDYCSVLRFKKVDAQKVKSRKTFSIIG